MSGNLDMTWPSEQSSLNFSQTCTFSDPKRTADTRSHSEGTRSVIESQRFLFPHHHKEATFLLLWRWLVAVACCCCCSLLRPGARHKHSCWAGDLSQRDGRIWFGGSCSSCSREAWSLLVPSEAVVGWHLVCGLLLYHARLNLDSVTFFYLLCSLVLLSWDAAEEVDHQFSTTDNRSDCLFVLQLRCNWCKTWIFTKRFLFVNISPPCHWFYLSKHPNWRPVFCLFFSLPGMFFLCFSLGRGDFLPESISVCFFFSLSLQEEVVEASIKDTRALWPRVSRRPAGQL